MTCCSVVPRVLTDTAVWPLFSPSLDAHRSRKVFTHRARAAEAMLQTWQAGRLQVAPYLLALASPESLALAPTGLLSLSVSTAGAPSRASGR